MGFFLLIQKSFLFFLLLLFFTKLNQNSVNGYPQFKSQNNVKEISLPTLLLSFLFCAPTPPTHTSSREPLDQLLIFLLYIQTMQPTFFLPFLQKMVTGEFSLIIAEREIFSPSLLPSFLFALY